MKKGERAKKIGGCERVKKGRPCCSSGDGRSEAINQGERKKRKKHDRLFQRNKVREGQKKEKKERGEFWGKE